MGTQAAGTDQMTYSKTLSFIHLALLGERVCESYIEGLQSIEVKCVGVIEHACPLVMKSRM